MIISCLGNNSGFFSSFFFMINHYIYCKKNNITFKLDTSNWLYKSLHGWEDYFINIDKERINYQNVLFKNHGEVIDNYSLNEYKDIIYQVYIYNNKIKTEIESVYDYLGLKHNNYDSIYIRRGDKLIYESVFIPSHKYIELLLEKNPSCSNLFIQTDDYNSVIDIQKYINDNKLNIHLYTLCNPDTKGFCTHNMSKYLLNNSFKIKINSEYILKIKNDVLNKPALYDLSPTEKYEHTIQLIVGIDIILHSNICICDYQSNVSRFIKLAHPNFDNVFSVLSPNKNVDLNLVQCPSYPCEQFI